MSTGSTDGASTQVFDRIRATVPLPPAPVAAASGRPRFAHARRRLARYLEVAVIAIATGVASAGLALLAYGITIAMTGAPGQAYPNVQHVSTMPTPRG